MVRNVLEIMLILSRFSRNVYLRRCYSSSRNIMRLKDRGMWQDIFPANSATEIKDLLNAAPQCVYAGLDPTASSLHIGNLLVLVNLLHWQRGGHNVIILVGGATGHIGDPSGKNSERDKLQQDFIDTNIKGIKANVENILHNHAKHFAHAGDKLGTVSIVNNADWYGKLTPTELLGGAARHLRMGTLLSRTSVQTRLNSAEGMSFTEFSYQLFQAYDWLHLFHTYGCRFQVGGCDQMGNMMTGQELISKTCKTQVYALTMPLITNEMGDKFGKSAGSAVWLSAAHTSPFNFYQFWMRLSDADACSMLPLFTFDPMGAISDLLRQHQEKPELHLAQKHLADQVTRLVHGEEGLAAAQNTSRALYAGDISAMRDLDGAQLATLFQGASTVDVMPALGMNVLEFAMKAGCFATQADALRIISAGGFYINQQRARNPNEVLNANIHRLPSGISLVRVGKRNYYIVNWLA